MTPTFAGRVQTRLALLGFVGAPLALLLALVLPRPSAMATYVDVAQVFLAGVLLTAIVGLGWEVLWHGLQQFRWEKDWPTLFGLITGIPEGLLVFCLLSAGVPWDFGSVPARTFAPMFVIVWIVVWLVTNGPIQALFIRWRFRGGRFI